MNVAFDTSVLVAGLVSAHPMHERAFAWIEAAHQRKLHGLMTTHAMAELWAVLTRLPMAAPVSGAMAEQMVNRVCRVIRPVPLTKPHYGAAMRRCAERGRRSGSVFDALHLVMAEAKRCTALVTFNPADFECLASPSGPRIVVPPDPPGLVIR